MPTAGTWKHTVRIEPELWKAALAKGERTGIPVAAKIREGLVEWVAEPDPEPTT